MSDFTTTELHEALSLPPLRGLAPAQALEAARAEKADRESNYRYWAQRGIGERGFRIARARVETIEHVVAVLEAAVVNPDAVEDQEPQLASAASTPRCPHYASIRRFFGLARARGLNIDATERMRQAFSCALGREVKTRAELSGADWRFLSNAVEHGLTW